MTLDRKTTDPRQMTAAAFKVARERLGLTTAWIARRMVVQERTVHRWEAGVSPVPEGVRIEMEILDIGAENVVNELVGQLSGQLEPVLLTYRTDADFHAHKGREMPASWHRAIAARVAERVPGLRIDYWERI